MKSRLKTNLWLIGVFLFWSHLALSAPPAPSIHLPATDFDFGEEKEGAVLSHDFLVANKGSGVLEIRDVRPG
ncbi:MAG: hypothetical protein HY879_22820 [Deltaproteobacteria bacterium]|nr:hypothetical protein [Deltaproteobacteria bacterium]